MCHALTGLRARLSVALALVLALAFPALALAATFTNHYPFGTVQAPPQIMSVTAFSPTPLDTRAAQIKLDGAAVTTLVRAGSTSGYWSATETWNAALQVWTVKWTWVPTTADPNKTTLYAYPVYSAPLSDGLHTVTATIKDKTGVAFTDTWTFSYGAAPALGTPTPADGSTADTTTPTISLPFTDNSTGACTATATVNGAPAAATISGGVVRVTSPGLPNDAPASVTVTVTDASGYRASKTWTFNVQIYPEMFSTTGQCTTCHVGYEDDPDMHEDCLACHNGMVDKPHVDTPSSYHAKADVSSCSPCHVSDLTVEHARYLGSNGSALSCATCHLSTDPNVVGAIATHQTACATCHVGVDHTSAHASAPAPFCAKSGCHVAANLLDEHINTPIKPASRATCDTCHKSSAPAVVAAIAAGDKQCQTCHGQMLSGHDAMHESVMEPECLHCHAGSISAEHIVLHNTGGTRTCASCHESTEPRIVTAIENQDRTCGGCHADAGHETGHASDFSGQDCADCHTPNIQVEHHRSTASSATARCANCHLTPSSVVVDALAGAAWDKKCAQTGCHVTGSATEAHANMTSAHDVSDPTPSCIDTGCHSGTDLGAIHSAASTDTPSGTRTGCRVCHSPNSMPSTKECATCHPDRLAPHGYDAALHESTEGCLVACHTAELKPAHDAEVTAKTTACADCHTTLVPGLQPAGWSRACDDCHPTVAPSTHLTPGGSHAGSDAFTRAYTANFPVRGWYGDSTYAFGCTPSPAAGQVVCHDVGNLATLHEELPDKGCPVCHNEDRTTRADANECLTCHGTGWYDPPYSKGTVVKPGSDFSSAGTVTRVGGSGSDNFSTLTSNDGATSYLQFASTNAEALFGKGFWWLNPNTTTVTNVQVLFRAMKLTTGTTNSRMTVVLNVGGTTYVSPAAVTNPSTAAYTQYSHTFTTNPKTGVAWTPTDLNDPNSANGLRAFGVRQTAADTANIGVTEVLLKVNTPNTSYPQPPRGGGQAHHYGDYLRTPETSTGVFSQAIYTQYCYDRCHVYPNTYAYYGQVLGNPSYNPFNAYQGDNMWSSLMGDPYGEEYSPTTRNLTLKPITLPAGAPQLDFMTNYSLGTGDFGYVEISTDGSTWTQLSGTEGGSPVSVYSGVAGSWRPAVYDLSAYAGQSVSLRFRYTNTAGASNPGWCIDNISISEGGVTVFSDDAETLKPEWDPASHWRRIKYALRFLG